jgi:spoIIIJ-associated protein
MEKKEVLKQIVQDLLKHGFGDKYYAEFTDVSENELKIDIFGDEVSYLIGQRGHTLSAFQLLVRQIYMNQTGDFSEELKILIDVDGYKTKRIEKIKDMAVNSAKKALTTQRQVTMPSMNAFERHIVHDFINENYPDLDTSSIGEEPNRKVVLTPKAL